MKKKWIIVLSAALFINSALPAQVVTKDSISVLNNEKERLKVAKSINDNKLKLVKLENQVPERTQNIETAASESQKAIAENQSAADALTGDPEDKGRSKQARKAARNAESKANASRKATQKLEDLNKDIENLRKKISDDEQKISALGG